MRAQCNPCERWGNGRGVASEPPGAGPDATMRKFHRPCRPDTNPQAGSHGVPQSLRPGADWHRARRDSRSHVSRGCRRDEAARRRVHQAGQDADHADRLHDGGGRDRADGGHEGRGPRRFPGPGLLRGRVDAGAGRRPGRRDHRAAGCRHARRSVDARCQRRRRLHVRRRSLQRHRVPPEHHPRQRRRCLRARRHPAGAVVLGAVRAGHAAPAARQRTARGPAGSACARPVRRRRTGDATGTDRCLRGHGVHDRHVRTRHAAVARQADGRRVHHVPAVRDRGTRHDRQARGLQHLQADTVRARGIADRARHLVVGIGAAARDGQDGAPRVAPSRSSAWWCRPAIPSISMAPPST